ncbi:MAG: hypothetical protein K2X38_11390 [Gemmataceae bacterium]|nr:hypothetical protein [Gemmataceae bacterium]
MKVVVRFTAKQESLALPILLRHAAGMALPERTYVLSDDTVRRLRDEGLEFTEVSREAAELNSGAIAGERV